MDPGPASQGGQGRTHGGVRNGAALHVGGQQVVVMVRQDVGGRRREARREAGVGRTRPRGGPHRHDRRGEPLGDRAQDTVGAGAAAVDLVDEEEGRDAQPLQGPHEDPRLRLDTLDGRDDQHGAVEHAEHPLHLRDEVRVAGGVDEVDRHVVDRERDDGGLDGDAALPLQREGVGPGVPVVDTADLVDHADRVQQPLGQAGLTCVDVREDAEVEHMHEASCPSKRGRFLSGGT